MSFWGIKVEPGKHFTHHFDKARGKLRITKATLGIGYMTETSVVQCSVGDNESPIFLCGFSPSKHERSCTLDLEFEEDDDVVFSVLGPLSVHLTGFFLGNGRSGDDGTEKKVESGGSNDDQLIKLKTYTVVQDAEAENKAQESEDNKSEVKLHQVTLFTNGLIIEDLEKGKHGGRIVTPESKVSIHYIGRLESNGFTFNANVGKEPSTFKLGEGRLVKGCEIGINGMRIGGKRRLTIPPYMGYGSEGFDYVPPNAWLVVDIELVDIC